MLPDFRPQRGESKELRGTSWACNLGRPVSVQVGYALWAPTYDRDPNPLLSLEERTLRALLPDLAGRVVLDVACGTGRWLEKLLAWGARSGAGVDLSGAMLDVARAKLLLRTRLVRGQCLTLPFRSGVADLTTCSFAVCHTSDLAGLARELARVAKPGSDLFLSDVHPEGFANGWRTGFRHRYGSSEIVCTPYSIRQVREAFQSEGFELLQLREPHLAEPEKQVFINAGKSHLFGVACRDAAVFVCHFGRRAPKGAKLPAPGRDGL